MLLVTEYDGKSYQIPLDDAARTVRILPDELSPVSCSMMVYYYGDRIGIFHHGNGCTRANQIEVNGGDGLDSSLNFDGMRVVPFYYD